MEFNPEEYKLQLKAEHPQWSEETINEFVQLRKQNVAWHKLQKTCVDGLGMHDLDRKSNWDDKQQSWSETVTCKKCGLHWGESPPGCRKAYDRKHNMVESTFVENDIKFAKKECSFCGAARTTPLIEDKI